MPEDYETSHVGAILNGACGALAMLYGEGDFEKTLNFACMIGMDADNQAATLAGLMGIIHGMQGIPEKYTHPLGLPVPIESGPASSPSDPASWSLPLNDVYRNITRDELPDAALTDIAARTCALGVQLIERHGGRVEGEGDKRAGDIARRAIYRAGGSALISDARGHRPGGDRGGRNTRWSTRSTAYGDICRYTPCRAADDVAAGAARAGGQAAARRRISASIHSHAAGADA
jgi:hypothetical protein